MISYVYLSAAVGEALHATMDMLIGFQSRSLAAAKCALMKYLRVIIQNHLEM